MLINSVGKLAASVALILSSGTTLAGSINPLSVDTTLKLTLNPGLESATVESLIEGKFFIDLNYLDKLGGGLGTIRQNKEYKDTEDISNQILFTNLWFSWYPALLSGKLSLAVDYFNADDNKFVAYADNGGVDHGQGQGTNTQGITSNIYAESFSVVNPSISYLNNNKTFYLTLSYSTTNYQTSQTVNQNLDVTQWAPAVGFGFNQNYDWLQLRYYGVSLSSDVRSPGVDRTDALGMSWTHWFTSGQQQGLHSTTLTLLGGKRIFGVEQDVRKIFNINDVQTASAAAGAMWRISSDTDISTFIGFEQYEDMNNRLSYENSFIDLTLILHW